MQIYALNINLAQILYCHFLTPWDISNPTQEPGGLIYKAQIEGGFSFLSWWVSIVSVYTNSYRNPAITEFDPELQAVRGFS